MKKIFLISILLMAPLFIFGCCDDDNVYIVRPDHTPPSVPKGIYSITADEAVWLYWEPNDERDLAGYRIYRKTDPNSNKYYHHATVDDPPYVDYEVDNGYTYYYGVTAFDFDGNESDLSDIAFDTPRPEGPGVMYDRFLEPSLSGFDFSGPDILDWEDDSTDVYLEYDGYLETFFLCIADSLTDIQDFGYTEDFDVATYAPERGWSNVGWVEVIEGHTYIIWTWNDHYAKLRVKEVVGDVKIYFDWGYQIAQSNPELAPRPSHAENYLRSVVREDKNSLE